MTDNLLHEIQHAHKYDFDRNLEFKAERFIREFKAEHTPYILEELYYECDNRLSEKQSSSQDIALYKMMKTLIKRKIKID